MHIRIQIALISQFTPKEEDNPTTGRVEIETGSVAPEPNTAAEKREKYYLIGIGYKFIRIPITPDQQIKEELA